MEPRIQYAQTKDGVSIAFWTMGEGMPLVHMPVPPLSRIQLEWQIPEIRRWYQGLARKRKHVRYDGRGSGLSDRDVGDYSLDAQVLDLEAVVDHLGLERFALFAPVWSGPVGTAYAVLHPERVSHLILINSFARASDVLGTPQAQALLALMEKDWELFTETMAHAGLGWSAGESARQYAALIRESVTQEAMQAFSAAADQFDVTVLLPQVKVPTLVVHRRQLAIPELSVARGLASHIPNASLVVVEGALYDVEGGSSVAAVVEFLGEGEEAAGGTAPSGLVTILFTDMEGSTSLTQRLGDAKAQEVLRTHNAIVREALKAHGGSEIKHTGDGIMASFGSASKALECAIAMQRAFAEQNESAEEPIRVRVGLNAGEPIAEEEDLFGTAVQLAARICAQAEAGQILAPIVVRELAAGKRFMFADLGEVALRGFEDPVRLYEVRWGD